ncbi:hypothetical protein [Catellatospora methionotrophica]|uniref:hypothetical protein n=1 Tax=Catellatospora methionotrophica TaxID=121620 RepID=UPI00140C9AA4|nr:hypothetical protein [Catellatospora methionotrophica]
MSPHGAGNDLALASLDFLGGEHELRERACSEVRAAGAALGTVGRSVGEAAGGSIQVTTNARGQVDDVQVSRDWSTKIEADAFAGQLFQAYRAALMQAINTVALRKFAESEQNDDSGRPAAGGGAIAEPSVDSREWLASVWADLREVDDTLHRLERQTSAVEVERKVASPHGYLTATCRAGHVTAISGDTRRIRGADSQQLRAAALAIFRAAQSGDQP